MNLINNIIIKKILFIFLFLFLLIFILHLTENPSLEGDWQEQFIVLPTVVFNEDQVTIKNVRNFRYYPTEEDMQPDYYDKTYNLNEIKKVWFISEPFNENTLAAHTFLSFEFENEDFLGISIEARKTKGQIYSIWKGMVNTYPLVYIAADERDLIPLRANVRKDKVYVYPVKLEKSENARLLLVDMLNEMNNLTVSPKWYNTLFSNCTSSIVKHINKLSPGRISSFSWQLWLTASADELALKHGLLDTDLSIKEAREKFFVTDISQKIGDVPNYSNIIRNLE
jgi:hypothetical protein